MSGYLQLLRGLRTHVSLWDEIFRLLDSLDASQKNEDAFSNARQSSTSNNRIRQSIDTVLGLLKKVKQYEFAKEVQVCLSCLQLAKSVVDTAQNAHAYTLCCRDQNAYAYTLCCRACALAFTVLANFGRFVSV